MDPDSRDLAPERVGISRVANFIQKHFSGVALKPSVVETCMYTVSVCESGTVRIYQNGVQ